MILMVVVLPAPFGPRRPKISPYETSKLTSPQRVERSRAPAIENTSEVLYLNSCMHTVLPPEQVWGKANCMTGEITDGLCESQCTEELTVLRLLWKTLGCSLSDQRRPVISWCKSCSLIVVPPYARMSIPRPQSATFETIPERICFVKWSRSYSDACLRQSTMASAQGTTQAAQSLLGKGGSAATMILSSYMKRSETLLAGLADWTDQRRLRPCAQVTTDPASPDRKREPGHRHLFHLLRVRSWPADRTPVRNRCCSLLATTDLGRDIQRAVAGAVFVEIGVSVVTRTDEVDIPLSYS